VAYFCVKFNAFYNNPKERYSLDKQNNFAYEKNIRRLNSSVLSPN